MKIDLNLVKIKQLLKKFSYDKIFDDFYLIGGTALSFDLGHRVSYDIDFMSDKKLNENLLNRLIVIYDAKFIPDINEVAFRINTGEDLRKYKMQFVIDNIKIKFFYPNDSLRNEILNKYKNKSEMFFGIKKLPLKAISEFKLIALFNRYKIRDLFDVYYLFYKDLISCEDIDRFLSIKFYKTFVEFLDSFKDDGSESLDFLDNQEFSYIKRNKTDTIKQLFKEEYIKRCM